MAFLPVPISIPVDLVVEGPGLDFNAFFASALAYPYRYNEE
jgi:hypothetical protein